MKRTRNFITVVIILWVAFVINTYAVIPDVEFRRIEVKDGLSNSQVNCIFKDSRGFLWFGTASGLNRYDGFKFKKFFTGNEDKRSIPGNSVSAICEDKDGNLWMNTNVGYVIYNSLTEVFDRNLTDWMERHGMKWKPDRVITDKNKNLWLSIYGKGCYYYDFKLRRHVFFPQGNRGARSIPKGIVVMITTCKEGVVLSYSDGTLACLDGIRGRIIWIDRHIPQSGNDKNQSYNVFVDSRGNIWIYTLGKTFVYTPKNRMWAKNVGEFAARNDIRSTAQVILTRAITEDRSGRLWIATDHLGLVVMDYKTRKMRNFVNDKNDNRTIPDNTLQSLYVDNDGTVWVGTYKNGIAYYGESVFKFKNINVGDVCTITEDKQGNYWFGTNDAGIVEYNPETHAQRIYNTKNSGLQADVIVSSCVAHDGTIWFGAYDGGLSHYHDGLFTTYRRSSKPGSLANDNVWSIVEDKYGLIWIGTLGAGVQCLNPRTGKFTTYNMANVGLASDFVASLCLDRNGNLVVGLSGNFSIMNIHTRKFTHFKSTRRGNVFSDPSVQQIFVDSRGLIWDGTCSGVNIYDPKSDQLDVLDNKDGLYGSVICSITEDSSHSIWMATDNGVANVRVTKQNGLLKYKVYRYNVMDGLQGRQFNQRSIFYTRDGQILIGGQDGVNVVNLRNLKFNRVAATALFSGLTLFDHEVGVGEVYNHRIILKQSINESRRLVLNYSENVFSIQLASTNYTLPEKTRFRYKLEGFSDKWFVTPESQHSVSFTNLAPGTYTLYVKVINGDGFESNKTSTLEIVINPPAWRTIWAYLLYVIIVAYVIYSIHKTSIKRQQNKFKIEQIRREAEKDHELDEMKLRFFTNVNHELRTPLSLIISPLASMIKDETNEKKRNMLKMIHRNSIRLLTLVNQLLDFRRIDMHGQKLNLLTGDIVNYIQNICNTFTALADKKVCLTFFTAVQSLTMSFDEDKIRKVVNNLLSNAFKFTPSGGRVDVSMRVLTAKEEYSENKLEIKVSDTGVGISTADKLHIFDRFYQAENQNDQVTSGSGIGLNLVKEFVEMHHGSVRVEDNPGGGSVFIVELPVIYDKNAVEMTSQSIENEVISEVDVNPETEIKDYINNGKEYEVMVVDDSDDFLHFMSDVLSEQYNVSLAHNGKVALDKIANHRPDIILSDVMMPEMDGNELCRCLKKNPETERIPFVMLTARLAEEHKMEGLTNGADDFITKPFNVDMLNMRIANLIKWNVSKGADGKIQPHIKEMKITSMDEKLVKSATDYVESHLADGEMSVEDLSAALNMSRVHLYKKILSLTGHTPSEFIRIIRLRHAEQLLRMSQLSVSEISYLVGFNNPRYFSKYFKEMYGVMPSAYKDEKGK
jgi:signal transduction histidine kinase/ligand-binding sensor domain-containing protein/DNA-binding response OmpR family regulator